MIMRYYITLSVYVSLICLTPSFLIEDTLTRRIQDLEVRSANVENWETFFIELIIKAISETVGEKIYIQPKLSSHLVKETFNRCRTYGFSPEAIEIIRAVNEIWYKVFKSWPKKETIFLGSVPEGKSTFACIYIKGANSQTY
jgi:hypothetical protein